MAAQLDRNSDTFLLDSLSGKGGFMDGKYLIRHAREDDAALAERAAVSVYANYVQDVVGTYSGYLWKRHPNRDVDDAYAAFTANADGAGNSLDGLLQQWQMLSMVIGSVWIIVDRAPVLPLTRAQQPQPYLSMRMPGQVVDVRWDRNGVLDRIVFREQADGGLTANGNLLGTVATALGIGGDVQYRMFDRNGWRISKDAAGRAVINQGEHGLGMVPVVRLNSTVPLLPGQVRAEPWAFGIIQRNWSLYNSMSELRTLFRKQAFSILTIPVVDDNEAERLRDLTIGTDNALTYNPQGGGQPAYIAPDNGPVESYQKENANTVVEIYKQANLEFVAGVAASGISLSFQFQKANASMGVLASQCEMAEQGVCRLVAAWNGEQPGKVTYPRDFNLSDLAADLQVAMDATNLQISPTFERELKKGVARKVLGHGASEKTMAEIDNEIDAGGDPYGDRMQQQAGP